MGGDLQSLAGEAFCYLTTTGRKSGRPHTIEIWFALHGHTLYLLSGGRARADWVKNARKQPHVSVRIKGTVFAGQGRLVSDAEEDAFARRLVASKYEAAGEEDLESWSNTALPMAVNLDI